MYKYLLILASLFVVGAICSFGHPTIAQAVVMNFPNDTLHYSDPDYGMEVMYPSTWKIDDRDFRGGDYVTNIVAFRPPFDSKDKSDKIEGRQAITFGIMHLPEVYSLDYAANSILDSARFELEDYKTVSSTTRGVTFDGKPAMKLIFEDEENNQNFRRIFLGYLNGSDVYYAGYRMKEKNFDKFLPIFDWMVETYNLTSTRS